MKWACIHKGVVLADADAPTGFYSYFCAWVAEQVDARDLKSLDP